MSESESFTVENRIGRLLEARVFSLRTADHASEYAETIARVIRGMPQSVRPVLCADHRPVVIYPQDVADRLVELFSEMNARLERVAILVAPTNATLTLQLQRIVREAKFVNRRVFHDAGQAIAHLSGGLDAPEIARARSFVGSFDPSR